MLRPFACGDRVAYDRGGCEYEGELERLWNGPVSGRVGVVKVGATITFVPIGLLRLAPSDPPANLRP